MFLWASWFFRNLDYILNAVLWSFRIAGRASPLILVEGVWLCVTLPEGAFEDKGSAVWRFPLSLPITSYSPFSFYTTAAKADKGFSGNRDCKLDKTGGINSPFQWLTGEIEITNSARGGCSFRQRSPELQMLSSLGSKGKGEDTFHICNMLVHGRSQWPAFSSYLDPNSWGRRWRICNLT